jgi:hypothetical protein
MDHRESPTISSGRPSTQGSASSTSGRRSTSPYTAAIRNFLSAKAETTDPRKYLAAGRQAIGDTVVDLCRAVAAPLPERVAR